MTITLEGIAIRARSRAPMQPLTQASVTEATGVADDFRGKPGKRQVTVLSREAWLQACAELGTELPWTVRRANVLISGATFSADDIGKVIRIGQVRLQIMCETDPCPRMDEQHSGLTAALLPDFRGGVCCRVLTGGEISLGSRVAIG